MKTGSLGPETNFLQECEGIKAVLKDQLVTALTFSCHLLPGPLVQAMQGWPGGFQGPAAIQQTLAGRTGPRRDSSWLKLEEPRGCSNLNHLPVQSWASSRIWEV